MCAMEAILYGKLRTANWVFNANRVINWEDALGRSEYTAALHLRWRALQTI